MSGNGSGSNALYLSFLTSTHFIIHVYTMLLPVLLLPLQDELGVGLVQLSLLSSIPRLLNVFIYIPTGMWADRQPSLVLTLSFIVTALGAIVVPMARTFPLLMVGFTLLSLGSTLYHPPSLKMASEFNPRRISLAMGLHNVGSSLGFATGPLLLGAMMSGWGWRYSFYIWMVLTLGMAVVSHLYTRNTLKGKEASSRGLSGDLKNLLTGDYLMVVAMATLVEAIFNILVTFVPVYFTVELGLSYGMTSIVTGLGPLTGILGSTLGGFTGDKYGRYRTGILVLGSVGVLLVIFPGLKILWLVLVVYGLYRALQAAFMPLMNSMIAAHSSSENRSLSYSFNFVAVNLAAAITPPTISYLIEQYNTVIIFPICIAAIIPTCGLIYLLRKRTITQI